jgi:uncharacterized protein YcaQ
MFEIKAIYLEPGIDISDELVSDVAEAIQACATWHQAGEVVVRRSNPKELKSLLEKKLRKL